MVCVRVGGGGTQGRAKGVYVTFKESTTKMVVIFKTLKAWINVGSEFGRVEVYGVWREGTMSSVEDGR
jgi:hypothetical protein